MRISVFAFSIFRLSYLDGYPLKQQNLITLKH